MLCILRAPSPQLIHMRNLWNWDMHPLSDRVMNLHQSSCMVELIWSHSRLKTLSKGDNSIHDVDQHYSPFK
jgi:hypothetical protein